MESSREKILSIVGAVPNRPGTSANRSPYPAAVRRATKFIDANLGQRMGLPKIAAAAGLSTFHFGRLFKQATGLSPHQYLLDRRISVAKDMLRTQRLSVAEIAAELGFYDQSHFSQVFKRNVGMTPRQFTEQF
jgi:AraC family transcriptional regulator